MSTPVDVDPATISDGLRDDVFVHPAGLCESTTVGGGTRVWAFAHVLAGAVVGRDCNICDGAFVEGGARLGDRVTVKNSVLVWDGVCVEDDVFLGPGVTFTNDLRPRSQMRSGTDHLLPTVVRKGATLGANSTVVPGVEIGAYAFVAAGAVVTRSVPAHAFVRGNPARRTGWVCVCGEPLGDELSCPVCCRRYATAEGDSAAMNGLVLIGQRRIGD
jgi:UDP-2-acetamido-3-amino-2,3-dideoxy-glucuronate N-acetyltransferase